MNEEKKEEKSFDNHQKPYKPLDIGGPSGWTPTRAEAKIAQWQEEDAHGSWRDAISEIKRQAEDGEAQRHPLHRTLFKPAKEREEPND